METTRTPYCLCPSCGAMLSAATGIDQRKAPKPNDLSVCAYCGTVLVFTEAMKVRVMSDMEWKELPINVRSKLALAQAMIKVSPPSGKKYGAA